MQRSTPIKQVIPPETTEMLFDEMEAIHPARAFPGSGPLK